VKNVRQASVETALCSAEIFEGGSRSFRGQPKDQKKYASARLEIGRTGRSQVMEKKEAFEIKSRRLVRISRWVQAVRFSSSSGKYGRAEEWNKARTNGRATVTLALVSGEQQLELSGQQ
jgi:hypothetical protein